MPCFVDPDNVKTGTAGSEGSVAGKSGRLNAPSIGYSSYSPLFRWDDAEGLYIGRQFWNGRSKNVIDQAKQPFLNPLEMAMSNTWTVVNRLKKIGYIRCCFKWSPA